MGKKKTKKERRRERKKKRKQERKKEGKKEKEKGRKGKERSRIKSKCDKKEIRIGRKIGIRGVAKGGRICGPLFDRFLCVVVKWLETSSTVS